MKSLRYWWFEILTIVMVAIILIVTAYSLYG